MDEGASFGGRGYYVGLLLRLRWMRLVAELRAGDGSPWRRLAGAVAPVVMTPSFYRKVRRLLKDREPHHGRRGQRRWLAHPALARRARPLPVPRRRRRKGGCNVTLTLRGPQRYPRPCCKETTTMGKTASDAWPAANRMAPAMTASASECGTRRMDETEFLLSSPENARRLRKAIAGLAAGEGVERELIECD